MTYGSLILTEQVINFPKLDWLPMSGPLVELTAGGIMGSNCARLLYNNSGEIQLGKDRDRTGMAELLSQISG